MWTRNKGTVVLVLGLALWMAWPAAAQMRKKKIAVSGCQPTYVQTGVNTWSTLQGPDLDGYAGEKWTNNTGVNVTICQLSFLMGHVGTITTFTYQAFVKSLNGSGNINGELGQSAAVTGSQSWDGSTTIVDYSFATPVSVANGAVVALCVTRTNGSGTLTATDASNYARIYINQAVGADNITNGGADKWGSNNIDFGYAHPDWDMSGKIWTQ